MTERPVHSTDDRVDQSTRADREMRLARLLRVGAGADGFITAAEAAACGFSDTSLRRLVESGTLERIAPRHYRPTNLPWTLQARHRQAVVRAGPQSMLGGTTALHVHGLLGRPPQIVVVCPRGVRGSGGEHRRIQSTDLLPSDAELCRGISTATPTRAILDAAQDLTVPVLHDVISEAVRRGVVADATLRMRFLEIARRGRPGMARLRRVLAARLPGDAPEATYFEQQLERIIATASLPAPTRQYRVRWRDRTYYLDHAWPEFGVWSECDSVLAHASASALHCDVERQNHIILATGFQPVRFSYRHVVEQPVDVAATLRSALGLAPVEHGPESAARRRFSAQVRNGHGGDGR